MKTVLKTLTMGIATMALATAPVSAHGFGDHPGPGLGGMGGGHGMLFPAVLHALNLTADQKTQIEQIMKRHRTAVEPLLEQLHTARGELAAKLIAPGTVKDTDLSPTIQHAGQLEQQVMQEWVQAALEARAVLTADQLAKAGQIKTQMDSLRAQMRQLLGGASAD
jgi:Spy/CpxP family protein refolding chaperone